MLGISSHINFEKKKPTQNHIQEMKILKFHFETTKSSLCFSVSMCFQKPSETPAVNQKCKASQNTLQSGNILSSGSVPSALVGDICLTGFQRYQEARKPVCVASPTGRMDWEQSLLYFQLGCFNSMASEFSLGK